MMNYNSAPSTSTYNPQNCYDPHQDVLNRLQQLQITSDGIAAALGVKPQPIFPIKSEVTYLQPTFHVLNGNLVPSASVNRFPPTINGSNDSTPSTSALSPPRLNIYYQNIRGVRGVKQQLQECFQKSPYDVIVLLETNLDSSQDLDLPNYTVYRTDRCRGKNSKKKTGGGVLIAVKSSIPQEPVALDSSTEEVWITLHFQTTLTIGAVYIPPRLLPEKNEPFFESVQEVVRNDPKSSVIVLGDFNMDSLNWERAGDAMMPTNVAHGKGFLLLYRLGRCGLYQRNHIPNRDGRFLDLMFSNSSNCVIGEIPPLLNDKREQCHPCLNILYNLPKREL